MSEIQELTATRRKVSELQTLKSEVTGLEARLSYSKRDHDNTVCVIVMICDVI